MGEATPLSVLVSEFLPSAVEAVEAAAVSVSEPPHIVSLGALRSPVFGNDPTELLKHRFLYRGGMCLLCGPTGIGKSSLLLQSAVHWSCGNGCFGITPGERYQDSGMRILLVQAENDEGDLAEMRDGVLAGCDDLSREQIVWACEHVFVSSVCGVSSDAFAAHLEAVITEGGPYDLVMIDPAFAYLGGDSNNQKDVSHFMRGLLDPLAQRHGVGLVIAHHSNKPMRGKEKDSWLAGDFAYLGAGSAEWVNPCRAALALRSVGSDDVFEFRAVKRGRRLRWVGADGLPTNVRYLAHDERPGVICWHEAGAEAVAAAAPASGGDRNTDRDTEVIHAVRANPGVTQRVLMALVAGRMDVSASTARRIIGAGVGRGWLEVAETEGGAALRYSVSEVGEAEAARRPSVLVWGVAKKGV